MFHFTSIISIFGSIIWHIYINRFPNLYNQWQELGITKSNIYQIMRMFAFFLYFQFYITCTTRLYVYFKLKIILNPLLQTFLIIIIEMKKIHSQVSAIRFNILNPRILDTIITFCKRSQRQHIRKSSCKTQNVNIDRINNIIQRIIEIQII